MARNNRDRLIETFLSRNRRRTPGGPAASFQPAKQASPATAATYQPAKQGVVVRRKTPKVRRVARY